MRSAQRAKGSYEAYVIQSCRAQRAIVVIYTKSYDHAFSPLLLLLCGPREMMMMPIWQPY